MRYFTQIISFVAVALLSLSACTKVQVEKFNDLENRSLKAWMLKNRPDLVENFQENGNYYVEILEAGAADSMAIHDVVADKKSDGCWLFFDLTGRSLQGDVCMTRNELIARQQGSFSRSTHYVPYLRYMGEKNLSLLEGSYLAMKNVLTLGAEYAEANGLKREFTMRCGTKVRLYLPSALISGEAGVTETGGYEGQYSLDGNKPMIMELEIVNRVNNPLAYEAELVEGFGEGNGGVEPVKKKEDGKKEKSAVEALRRSLSQHQSSDAAQTTKAWRHAQDTIPGIILNNSYIPDPERPFNFAFRFAKLKTDLEVKYADNKPYTDTDIYKNGPNAIDKLIDEALVKRFGQGATDGAKVGNDAARIWYIGRFLDGFIFDTNIDEVKQIIYGKVDDKGTHLSYSAATDKDDYITAWYYAIPELRYNSWATIVTTSSFAYGVTGQSGSSTTSTSTDMSAYYDYMNYMNYYNYYNTYYGNGYYNNYYMNYYNYANMYGSPTIDTSNAVTKTTVSTEILPYTPLIFQIFIEKKSTDVSDII